MRSSIKAYDSPQAIIKGLNDEQAERVDAQYKGAGLMLRALRRSLEIRLNQILEEDEKEENFSTTHLDNKRDYNLGRRKEIRRLIKMLPSPDGVFE